VLEKRFLQVKVSKTKRHFDKWLALLEENIWDARVALFWNIIQVCQLNFKLIHV